MIDYFRELPPGHYPPDGCALLVRDAWQRLYGHDGLPAHADQFVTVAGAGLHLAEYRGTLLVPLARPAHGCMVVATRAGSWHCGVFSTEQAPGYVIHTLGGRIRIESLTQFQRRFDAIEFYGYAAHHRVSPPGSPG